MKTQLMPFALSLITGLLLGHTTACSQEASSSMARPKMGAKAPDFKLMSIDGEKVQLSSMAKESNVVLVVLRGYPGYQCPLCSRQVSELRSKASQLASASAKVLLVYPGPAANLGMKAKEFLNDSSLPEGFTMVLDPDYKFTNAYGLRWNAPNETAYPSTFIIDKTGTIKFAEVSGGHSGRVASDTVLAKLKAIGS